jgi:hypothetical protein
MGLDFKYSFKGHCFCPAKDRLKRRVLLMSKMISFLSLGMLLVLVCGCGEEPKKDATPDTDPAAATSTTKDDSACKDGVCKLKHEAVTKPVVECKDGVCKLKEECKTADKCVCDDKTNPKCKSAAVKAPEVMGSETK